MEKTTNVRNMTVIGHGSDIQLAIRECDPAGPLVLFVAKTVPTDERGRFYALGRVFAGTVRAGQSVRIQGARYAPGRKDDAHVRTVQRVVLLIGFNVDTLADCPAGNIVGLGRSRRRRRRIIFSDCVAVEVAGPADQPRLVEGLKRLAASDSMAQTRITESGEHVVAAAGELHLEIALKDLGDLVGLSIKASSPFSRSPNKQNRLYVTALPLGDALTGAIEAGKITGRDDVRLRARALADAHGWDAAEARRIWAFGPDGTSGLNVLVEATKGVQHLHEIRDACVTGMHWATDSGVLEEEPMRGVRLLHPDAIHRGVGQIVETMRRVVHAASFLAQPVLQEPVLFVPRERGRRRVQLPQALSTRRAQVFSEEPRADAPLFTVKAYVPVSESFGLSEVLHQATGGQAFPQSMFDHWAAVPGSPLQMGSRARDIVAKIRTRKGLSPEVPPLEDYLDKL
ncbi:ribosomal protein S5 domain 2-type protein [Mycena pura]|uniref:Ribosomal protein S5 domain 2-type protein n=1 Tax=Mycena pura TaxID=153505 RepID=A0AAD6V986_9AGAR|nr:ribosomal protein S5 domain 2-type protein [Mycena pura]